MIQDLIAQLKAPVFEEVPMEVVGEEVFAGLTISSEFAQCLSTALTAIRKNPELWSEERMLLYFPTDELAVVELLFPTPLHAGLGAGTITAFTAGLCCGERSPAFLEKGEHVGMRIENGIARDFYARGPVERVPYALRGPMESLRFALKRAAMT